MKLYCAIMYGQGGQAVDVALTGGGIDRLARRIRLLHSEVTVEVFDHDQTQRVYDRIKSLPLSVKVVIGGTSLGANNAPFVAAALARPVDYLFGIQPSLYGARQAVTANVRRAHYWYQPWGFAWGIGFGLGSYQWQRASGNKVTVIKGEYTYVSHPGSNSEAIQKAIVDQIIRLLA